MFGSTTQSSECEKVPFKKNKESLSYLVPARRVTTAGYFQTIKSIKENGGREQKASEDSKKHQKRCWFELGGEQAYIAVCWLVLGASSL
jgi:hypothetical protein